MPSVIGPEDALIILKGAIAGTAAAGQILGGLNVTASHQTTKKTLGAATQVVLSSPTALPPICDTSNGGVEFRAYLELRYFKFNGHLFRLMAGDSFFAFSGDGIFANSATQISLALTIPAGFTASGTWEVYK